MTQANGTLIQQREITDPVEIVSLDSVDRVHVYLDQAGEYRWRRIAAGNFATIAGPQEGYSSPQWAEVMALRCNAAPFLLSGDARPGRTFLVEAKVDQT